MLILIHIINNQIKLIFCELVIPFKVRIIWILLFSFYRWCFVYMYRHRNLDRNLAHQSFTLCQWWWAEIRAEWLWNPFIPNFGPNFAPICCCTTPNRCLCLCRYTCIRPDTLISRTIWRSLSRRDSSVQANRMSEFGSNWYILQFFVNSTMIR